MTPIEGDFDQFKALLAMNGIDLGRLAIGDEAPAPSLATLKKLGAERGIEYYITYAGEKIFRFHTVLSYESLNLN